MKKFRYLWAVLALCFTGAANAQWFGAPDDYYASFRCGNGVIPSYVANGQYAGIGPTLWCSLKVHQPDAIYYPGLYDFFVEDATYSEGRILFSTIFGDEIVGEEKLWSTIDGGYELFSFIPCQAGPGGETVFVSNYASFGQTSAVNQPNLQSFYYEDYIIAPEFTGFCPPEPEPPIENRRPTLNIEQVACDTGRWELMVGGGINGNRWEWQRKYGRYGTWRNISNTYVPYRTIYESTGATHSYRVRVVDGSRRSQWSASRGAYNDVCYDEGPVPEPNPIPIDRQ